MRLACIVLTCDRPELLKNTICDLHATQLPAGWTFDITLVDNSETAEGHEAVNTLLVHDSIVARVVRSKYNIGIAAGWNLGYAAACAQNHFAGVTEPPDAIALIQDDVALRCDWFVQCQQALATWQDLAVVSGYNSPYHPTSAKREQGALKLYVQDALPGVHLVAAHVFWELVFPIEVTAHHMGEDYWLTRDAKFAPRQLDMVCGVVPGLVQHMGGTCSSWNAATHAEYRDAEAEVL